MNTLKKSNAILPADLFDWIYDFYQSNNSKMTSSDIKFLKIFVKTLAYEFDEKASFFDKFIDKADSMPSAFTIQETLAGYRPSVNAQEEFKDIL